MWNNQNTVNRQTHSEFQLKSARSSSPYWSLVSDTVADSTYFQLFSCARAAVRGTLLETYALARAC